MTNEELKNKISGWYGDLQFSEKGTYLSVEVPAKLLKTLAAKLQSEPDCAFNYLFCVTGMDYGNELGVVYHLESTKFRHILVLKVKTADRENPEFDTLTELWPAAYWNEMEVFDFFGIKFTGHPHLKRLFMSEDWVGYPLRKDYVDNVNMITR